MNKRIKFILDYWFDDIDKDPTKITARNKLWWHKDLATDQWITDHFKDDLIKLKQGELDDWLTSPEGRLAQIIILDQFSRNIYRNQAQAFSNDSLAIKLAEEGIALGVDKKLGYFQRIFFYIPFEHSEDFSQQLQSLEYFAQLKNEVPEQLKGIFNNVYDYANQHKVVIETYHRFPHRNSVLQRPSTAAEEEYLAKPSSGF